jgi:hypothetical protein
MARTTVIISDDLRVAGLGASARITRGVVADAIEIRIGDEVVRIHVPAEQANGIAAAIAADLYACLPVVGDPA